MLRLSRLLWVMLLVGAFLVLGNGRAEATTGLASWYGDRWAGEPTASGDAFDPAAFTAAHKTLPFGTRLEVSYRGRSTRVTVNDRGPYTGGRDLDLSRGAAGYLGLVRAGVGRVDYTVIGRDGYGAGRPSGYGARRSADYDARDSARDSAGPARDNRRQRLASNRARGFRVLSDRARAGGGSYYVVRPGDTLWGISQRFGTTARGLASANGIANPGVISPGRKIHY